MRRFHRCGHEFRYRYTSAFFPNSIFIRNTIIPINTDERHGKLNSHACCAHTTTVQITSERKIKRQAQKHISIEGQNYQVDLTLYSHTNKTLAKRIFTNAFSHPFHGTAASQPVNHSEMPAGKKTPTMKNDKTRCRLCVVALVSLACKQLRPHNGIFSRVCVCVGVYVSHHPNPTQRIRKTVYEPTTCANCGCMPSGSILFSLRQRELRILINDTCHKCLPHNLACVKHTLKFLMAPRFNVCADIVARNMLEFQRVKCLLRIELLVTIY